MTHGERVIAALVAAVSAIRTAGSYLTDAGAVVLDTPAFREMARDEQWLTLVYESDEDVGNGAGAHGNGQSDVPIAVTVNIDVHWRATGPGSLYQRVKRDLRQALLPGRINDANGPLGGLIVQGPSLITDQLEAGIVGLRQPVIVRYRERVGAPDIITT